MGNYKLLQVSIPFFDFGNMGPDLCEVYVTLTPNFDNYACLFVVVLLGVGELGVIILLLSFIHVLLTFKGFIFFRNGVNCFKGKKK